jgi:membrane-bound lytic murein transglycosylase B
VVERDRRQNEFTKTIWDYLDTAVSDDRIANGQAALATHAATFDAIEARYGVDRHIVAAIWGLESAYGTFKGDVPTLSALATLAAEGRRAAMFEEQFISALRILEGGHVAPEGMLGSWAGAMGHTQFMPTSFITYAVDFTGDGRRDIWGDDPTDALASTAAYLAGFGWTNGQPWGVEVRVPPGFDYLLARDGNRQTTGAWATLGVRGLDGRVVPDHGPAQLLLPAGAQGAAFLIFRNFNVLERYNTADAYVIAVGHLADRLRGGPAIAGDWPRGDRALTFDERVEMQTLLTARGFDTLGVDGLVGPRTIAAIRAFQLDQGLPPDGYAPASLLERLR